jgi:hypothetical protein
MFLKRFEPYQPEDDRKPNDTYSRNDQRIGRVTRLINNLYTAITPSSFNLNQPLLPRNIRGMRAVFSLQFGEDV